MAPSLSEGGEGVGKISFNDDTFCVILGKSLYIFEFSNDEKPVKLKYNWNGISESESILDIQWVEKNCLILLSNTSLYLFLLNNKILIKEYNLTHFNSYNNFEAELLIISEHFNTTGDGEVILAVINFNFGFFFVSFERSRSDYFINIGNLIKLEGSGKIISFRDEIIFLNSKVIERLIIDKVKLSCSIVDSISIGSILSKTTEATEITLLSGFKISLDDVDNAIIRLVFLINSNSVENYKVEMEISASGFIPVKFSKTNFEDKILSISQSRLKTGIPIVTTNCEDILIIQSGESDIKSNLTIFRDLSSYFTPYIAQNNIESNIIYIGGFFENKTNNLNLDIIEFESHPNHIQTEVLSIEYENVANGKREILKKIDELLNKKTDHSILFDTILPLFTKLISIAGEGDYSQIIELIKIVPLLNADDGIKFYSQIISEFESMKSNEKHVMNMNLLLQKLITFDVIIKYNETNFETALRMCFEEGFNVNMKMSWNNLLKEFYKCNLGKLCNCFLSLNLIEEFFLLFNRHYANIGNGNQEFKSEILLEFLDNLPIVLPEHIEREIPSWLINQIFPFVQDRDKLLDWIAERTITLEHVSKGDIDRCMFLLTSVFLNKEYSWEINNLTLPKQIVSNGILWAGSGNKRYIIKKLISNKINEVYWALLECNEIRKRYKLEIDFHSLYHKKISQKDIAYKLLSRISSSEILFDEVEHHVIPFCKSRGLDADIIITEYLVDLISSLDCEYFGISQKGNLARQKLYFRPRIIALINTIKKDECKAHALLKYLSIFNKNEYSMDNSGNVKIDELTSCEFNSLLKYTKNSTIDERKSTELKNRVALIDAKNLLSRYNLDCMASVILFEKNAPRRLLMHLLSQVDAGIESFNDAMILINKLERETSTSFMGVAEAFCLRLRFITFRKKHLVGWEEYKKKKLQKEIRNKPLEEEIFELLTLINCKREMQTVVQQYACFVWQFLDFYEADYKDFQRLRNKCEIATYSAIVVLRELKKTKQSYVKSSQTFWGSNELFSTFIRIQSLQFEFGIFLRPSDIIIDKIHFDENISSIECGEFKNHDFDFFDRRDTAFKPLGNTNSNYFRPILNLEYNTEWECQYFHSYEELRYEKLCNIFDKCAQPFIEVCNFNEEKRGNLTKLLRLGSLIGVNENYIRRFFFRNSIKNLNKLSVFEVLKQELYKTPTPKNSIIIVDEVQSIMKELLSCNLFLTKKSNWDTKSLIAVNSLDLLCIFSSVLEVLATCTPYSPIRFVSFILSLSGDILWSQDFLIQASDAFENFENSNSSLLYALDNGNIFSKSILMLLKGSYFVSLDSNKFKFKEICTLYPSNDAFQAITKFLSKKIGISKEFSKQISAKADIPLLTIFNFWDDPEAWTINCNEDEYAISTYMQDLKENINSMVEQLYKFECLSLAMSIYLKYPYILDISLISKINSEFFRKVLKGKDPMDGQLCMALSSTLEKKDTWNIFVQSLNPSNILDNYNRAQRMARIGWDLGILYNHYSMRKEMEELHRQSKWCDNFRKMKINFDQSLFFQKQDPKNVNDGYRKSIIQEIIRKSNFDLLLCLQYARDYNINDEYVLLHWSKKMILFYFHPKFELKMQNILSFVTPELCKEIFESTFSFISSFNYERLAFILSWYLQKWSETNITESKINSSYFTTKIGKEREKKYITVKSKLEILKIMRSHSRISRPEHDEKIFVQKEFDRLCKSHFENGIKDEGINQQVKYRIPFHYLLESPLKALKYEINDESIFKIKKISQLLGIEKVEIDIQFVWNIVMCRKYKNSKHDFQCSEEFQEYCIKLMENDEILLRYIDSIGSFDLESCIAIIILIIDELPLSQTKISLIEWSETKRRDLSKVELVKGYPKVEVKGISSRRHCEVIDDIEGYLRSKKRIIKTALILEKHGLDCLFSNIFEETNDIYIFLNSLYYYLTPIIIEGIYWKFENKLQEMICHSFCVRHQYCEHQNTSTQSKNLETRSDNSSQWANLGENFNTFIEEISNAHSIDIKKIRIAIIKNLLSKPLESPLETIKNKSANIKQIFELIDNSGIINGFEHWFNKGTTYSELYDYTYIDRISLVCTGISTSDSILLLLSISFKSSNNYSYSTKCNALRTLFQTSSIKSIQKRYPKYDDLQVIWLHNYYMVFFHELHIPQDFSKFYLTEKTGLARSLWREYSNRISSNEVFRTETEYPRVISEENGMIDFKDDIRKRKMRCIVEKENEHEYLNEKNSSITCKFQFSGIKSNRILYLILEMCIDFRIFDSNLFSKSIRNIYLNLQNKAETYLLSDIIYASYCDGYIHNLNINKSIVGTWNLLTVDPLISIKNSIDCFSKRFWSCDQSEKISDNMNFDIEMFFKLSDREYLIPLLNKIYNKCPIIPFIEIENVIDASIGLINSIFNLKMMIKAYITDLNSSNEVNKREYISCILKNTGKFFLDIVTILSENNKFYKINKRINIQLSNINVISVHEIYELLDLTILELLFTYMRPIDLHYSIYTSKREEIFKRLLGLINNNRLIPYIIYATNSENLISVLSSELVDSNNIGIFLEISNDLNNLVNNPRVTNIEELFLIECMKRKKIYEYISSKIFERNNLECIKIIKRCVEYYKIETVIPIIIQFLSGQVKSESVITNQLTDQEIEDENGCKLTKLEAYNYIKGLIIKLVKNFNSHGIVQELIEEFR
ncbi:rough deal protein C-terminal region-domain-containing protein [Cryptosporidium felis]|nr:rough deal protein C-terminal region-domain-containing protein [Cryptosporidium felis]